MSSVDHTPEALGIEWLVMPPSSEAWFAQQKLPTTVVVFLLVFLTIPRVTWRPILAFRSACWGCKGLPSYRLKLPPHLIQEHPSKVALGDSNDVGLVLPKGQLCKVGQGLGIADSDIDKMDGDAGGTTPAAGCWTMMRMLQDLAGSC